MLPAPSCEVSSSALELREATEDDADFCMRAASFADRLLTMSHQYMRFKHYCKVPLLDSPRYVVELAPEKNTLLMRLLDCTELYAQSEYKPPTCSNRSRSRRTHWLLLALSFCISSSRRTGSCRGGEDLPSTQRKGSKICCADLPARLGTSRHCGRANPHVTSICLHR